MARLNKREKANNKKMVSTNKKSKKSLFKNALLLKQTLVATWKSKLQLVILLLLTAFATSLVTGSWISYVRMIEGSNQLGLNDLKFDAVLPYSPVSQDIKQIANQAFSLKLGRFYVQDGTNSKSTKALYFDDTKIGTDQEILPITKDNLTIDYTRDNTGNITGFNDIRWTNPDNPLLFNLNNNNVKASIYGQFLLKSKNAANENLKNHFKTAADDLYRDVFLKKTAPNILQSINTFIKEWITKHSTDPILKETDNDKVTTWILENKINFRSSSNDATIPDSVNLQDPTERNELFIKVVKETETDPKLDNEYGMNGQWMRIYRNFSATESDSNIYTNFTNTSIGYHSPFNYNVISDGTERDAFSTYLIRAVAALQMRDLYVRNQFTASAGVINNTQINTKIIDIGLPNALNHTNLKVFEGVAPTSKNEIVITPQYARKNKSNKAYKPGDHININGTDFIVSGIGGDAYDIYPTISDLDPIPNTRTEFIAYVTPSAWNDGNWYKTADKTDNTLMYFTKWNNIPKNSIHEFDVDLFNDFFQKTIFSDNGVSDLNQYDYNKYLVEKYGNTNPTPQSSSTYLINPNPVVTSSNSQFSLYNSKEKIFNSAIIGFLFAAIAGVLFLLAVVIFITTLIVKKAIQHGQVSMGILKSIGYKTWQITISYLAYPLLTLLIAIPIGWIVGLVIQVYLTEIFNTLFVLPYNVFNFDVVPLFISIVLIIGFITVVTLLTAFRLLKRDPLFLIKKDSDLALGVPKSRASKFLQNNFRLRFLLSLSKTSWKKILVTSGVITLASLSIVATTLVPATINSLKVNYFKTQKYKNYYEYQTPMPNMPMSKYGLYSWDFFNRPSGEKYYPTYGAMPWPEDKIVYDEKKARVGWYNPLLFKKEKLTNNFADIFTFDSSFPESERAEFIKKMSSYYQEQSTGTLDLNDLVWSYSWLGGKAFSNQLITDLSKEDNTPSKIFSYNIVNFASGQLPNILQVPNPGVPPGPEAIKEILKQVLPGFVRQSFDSLPRPNIKEDPYDYFSIGHNTIAFNPKTTNNGDINGPDEELVTQFKVGVDESTKIAKKELMDVIGINPNTAMLVLKNDEVKALKYNANANAIPMVINRAFQSKFGLDVGSQFSGVPQVNTLCYKNIDGKSIPLPKENWYYGETPPTDSYTTNGGIWSKSGTKWNYRGDQKIKLSDNSKEYSDIHGTRYNGMYDEKGQPIINNEPNTWNNVNDIWLKLPSDIDHHAIEGTIPTADGTKIIEFNLENISDLTGKWIRPFSYDLVKSYNGFDPKDPLSILLNRPAEWFMGMVNNNILTKENNINADSLQADIKNNMPTWWKNITGNDNPLHTYQVVGIQDSYDTPKAYVDQKWANEIMGYSYIDDNPYYSGTDVFQWFNGKLSANANVFDLIGRMSFKSNLDDYTIYATTSLSGNQNIPMVKKNYLLSKQQAMLTKMSDIAFSASALFIVTTIICSILIVIMITDLFTDQFRRFMAHMKAEGYTNWEINSFTLGIFTPWALLGYIVGFALGYLAIYGLINILISFVGVALPFTITWWILPVSFIIIGGIYISTFIINNHELNKMNLIELLKSDE
ncbi:ABC transporter permease [Spiroplasma endosymbiont of Phycita roborella]|uniref:ABC transporter permease n=1 Tax=Spiroplasma endosymbiont of Phycita roborella TaxID=3066311 RepID=UPI00313E1297